MVAVITPATVLVALKDELHVDALVLSVDDRFGFPELCIDGVAKFAGKLLEACSGGRGCVRAVRRCWSRVVLRRRVSHGCRFLFRLHVGSNCSKGRR